MHWDTGLCLQLESRATGRDQAIPELCASSYFFHDSDILTTLDITHSDGLETNFPRTLVAL